MSFLLLNSTVLPIVVCARSPADQDGRTQNQDRMEPLLSLIHSDPQSASRPRRPGRERTQRTRPNQVSEVGPLSSPGARLRRADPHVRGAVCAERGSPSLQSCLTALTGIAGQGIWHALTASLAALPASLDWRGSIGVNGTCVGGARRGWHALPASLGW